VEFSRLNGGSAMPFLLGASRHGGEEGSGSGGGRSLQSFFHQGRSFASLVFMQAMSLRMYPMADWRPLHPLASVTVLSSQCLQVVFNR
jgi:hypothetical protein